MRPMLICRWLAFLSVAAMASACAKEDASSPRPDTSGAGDPSQVTSTPVESRSAALNGAPPESAFIEATRVTPEGEIVRIRLTRPIPTIEVQSGGRCGVMNAAGSLLSCQAGTVCESAGAEGAPGTCVRAPAVAPWGG
jgi:hypothetical protein